ncbi:formin-like protein 2, partial [Aphis craccivora]
LKLKTVHKEAKLHYKRFYNRLISHSNPLVKNLTVPTISSNPPRRFKCK